MKMHMNKGQFKPDKRNCQIWLYGFSFRVMYTKKRLGNLQLQVRTTVEARHVSGVFLHGGSERSLCETFKVNLGLGWKL